MIKAIEDGSPVDLSQLPPPPPEMNLMTTAPTDGAQQTEVRQSTTNSQSVSGSEIEAQNIELTDEDAKKFFNAPPPPNTIMEALEQRLNKFKATLVQANNEDNSSKARRLGRIVKQYETAIKDFKKGKTLNFDDLPTPPGLHCCLLN